MTFNLAELSTGLAKPSTRWLLTLKSAFYCFFNFKECLLIGYYTKMDLYSQPT